MKPFRSNAAVLTMTAALLALPTQAQVVTQNSSGDPVYISDTPKAYSMVGDLLVARPLLIGATFIGTVAFVVSLPFTAASGGVGSAGQALVLEPAEAAFVRCLGCTRTGYGVGE
ncbi:multidrug transporter [Azomonas macrocytogenes]|uniref:Multidrug transporter n=1 Tax=Azomonas macrocytogenes TaxID=69962 RepID=A0A839T2W7_AZOMA|nr:multidrug transporter [Azomonas macrocytogenes]MBB3103448.1 hypothetical protein [Azomonas macrocytogenes]